MAETPGISEKDFEATLPSTIRKILDPTRPRTTLRLGVGERTDRLMYRDLEGLKEQSIYEPQRGETGKFEGTINLLTDPPEQIMLREGILEIREQIRRAMRIRSIKPFTNEGDIANGLRLRAGAIPPGEKDVVVLNGKNYLLSDIGLALLDADDDTFYKCLGYPTPVVEHNNISGEGSQRIQALFKHILLYDGQYAAPLRNRIMKDIRNRNTWFGHPMGIMY